ncbi:BQ2448_1479 [Microbotryum intermedium]|uniref:BQ2448_1479 protein n=1 Tax=Microbotryum intermedium TaxID=269621 RepID=A0A238FA50_9BASI|nr:BQ2448_1479 [Microbotryum intermedium]
MHTRFRQGGGPLEEIQRPRPTSTSTTIAPSTTEQSARSLVEGRYSIILQELTRWVQPSPSTLGDAARAETLGIDLPMGSLAVSFFALTFDAVKAAPSPTRATVQRLVAATSRPSTQVRPAPDSDSDGRDGTYGARRTAKARKISSGTNATRRASNTPQGRARANDSSKPRTPPASDQTASAVLSSDPETFAGRCFTSAPTSAGWRPKTFSLPGLCLEPKSITVTKDRQFEIKASLSNGHWSTMSYTGTRRVDLVEIEFNIVSSVSSASPLSSRHLRGPESQVCEEELTDVRIPLGLSDWFESTADLRLEKLVGTGSTAGGWLANVIGTNRRSESPDTKVPLVDGPVLNKTYFLILVSCDFVCSVIRETLFYQQVFPHLPDHLRSYLPRYHGTYRGSNGNGYAMVFENVGTYMNARDAYGSPGQWWEIEEAFAKLGIIHTDVSAGNVLVRPNNGGFCLVDWGRSYFKPQV